MYKVKRKSLLSIYNASFNEGVFGAVFLVPSQGSCYVLSFGKAIAIVNRVDDDGLSAAVYDFLKSKEKKAVKIQKCCFDSIGILLVAVGDSKEVGLSVDVSGSKFNFGGTEIDVCADDLPDNLAGFLNENKRNEERFVRINPSLLSRLVCSVGLEDSVVIGVAGPEDPVFVYRDDGVRAGALMPMKQKESFCLDEFKF